MANKQQQSGMQGVYLVAAELVGRGFIVSVTSRGAEGADLLVTDHACAHAWSVQVKSTIKPNVGSHGNYFIVGPKGQQVKARSHFYVFLSLRGTDSEFYIVPSRVVAKNVRAQTWGKFTRYDWVAQKRYLNAWDQLR